VYNTQENIVSLATIPGKAALNVIRCSGKESLALYTSLFCKKKHPLPNMVSLHSAYYNKQTIDQCMVVYFKGPKSYTGEDMLEISTHGGTIIAKKLIEIIEKNKFRQALPGEFTYRSFINGKIDLLQAESIQSAIDSGNSLDALYSINNIKGSLSKKIVLLTKKIKHTLTHMEHELDFNEGEIDFRSQDKYIKDLKSSVSLISDTLRFSYLANENKSSACVALVGKTNAGKSSLFNALLGYERSIVTSKQGTTRDTVEAEIVINQLSVQIIDTAGIRKTKEAIEKKGISRTYDAIKKADIIVFVDENSPQESYKSFEGLIKNKKTIFIKSKCDLKKHAKEAGSISLSSKTGEGLESLFKKMNKELDIYLKNFVDNNLFLINVRQKKILQETSLILEKTIKTYKETEDLSIVASKLREAFNKLKDLQGYNNKDEIINNIFKGFCVGK